MNHWERVRRSLPCAFGCEIKYPDWAYFAKWRTIFCEACAWKHYKLSPPVAEVEVPASREVDA